MSEARLSKVMHVIEDIGVEALLVFGKTSIRYFSGFTGSDGVLFLTCSDTCLLCDSRYTLQADNESPLFEIIEYEVKRDGVASALKKSNCKRVAFDADKLSVSFFNSLVAAVPDIEFIPLADQLDQIRSVKSPEEMNMIAFAAELASSCFQELLPMIRPGVTERAVALELEMLMKRKDDCEKAFEFIVASGVRGALPHGRPTEKPLSAGEMITIDFGACYYGYNSDETVTIVLGAPDSRMMEIYDVVKQAHDLAIMAVTPGIDCLALDQIARMHIENCGFGKYFGHALGHGVGLEVHEKPTLSSRSTHKIVQGMVFTVEPGIYLPNLGGVRIEDMVHVTADGCTVLSKVNKELIIC